MSPTQLTLRLLRKAEYFAEVVERWNPHAKIRRDLFGFIDVVGLHPQKSGLLGVQTTTLINLQKRRDKLVDDPYVFERMPAWIEAGNTLQLHGWRKILKKKKDGSYSKVRQWKPVIEIITLEDMDGQKEKRHPKGPGSANERTQV